MDAKGNIILLVDALSEGSGLEWSKKECGHDDMIKIRLKTKVLSLPKAKNQKRGDFYFFIFSLSHKSKEKKTPEEINLRSQNPRRHPIRRRSTEGIEIAIRSISLLDLVGISPFF